MSEDPGAKKGPSLLKGFSPILAKLQERNDERKEFLKRMRDQFFTWTPAPRRHTKKPILRGAKKRKKNKAVREARKHNRPAKKNRRSK